MNITFLSPYSPGKDFGGGGVERYLWYLIKGFADRDKVKVITSLKNFHDGFGGVDYITSPYIETFRHRPIFVPWKLFSLETDIIHANSTYPLVSDLPSIITRLKKVPSVLTYHFDLEVTKSSPIQYFYYKTFGKLMKFYDRIIVTSQTFLKNSHFLRKINREKIELVPLGIDTEFFSPKKQHKGPATSKSKILFVGEFVDYKGVDFLLKTLSRSGLDFEIRLVGDGPLKEQYLKLSRKLGISDRVVFTGRLSDKGLLDSYGWCDFLVLPSTFKESFGLVLLEAQACSKPVIGPELPGVCEAVGDGGLTFFPGKINSLSDAIHTLASDPELRKSLGKKGRKSVCQKHSILKMIENTRKVYLDLF